jgi:hypothetical protein
MMRRLSRRAPVKPAAWALGVLIPLGLLAGALLLASPKLLTGRWPFGITQDEVRWYSRLVGAVVEPEGTLQEPEVYRIDAVDGTCADAVGAERRITLTLDDARHAGSLSTMDGALVLRFSPDNAPKGQEALRFTPAGPTAIRAKYLEILADELGLPVAGVSFVRLILCGVDQGIHIKEEVMSAAMLARRGISDATVFTVYTDPGAQRALFPIVADTLMTAEMRTLWSAMYADLLRGATGTTTRLLDTDMTAAWLLMRWLDGGDPGPTMAFMHRRSTNRIAPLYERASGTAPTVRMTTDPVAAVLGDAALREAVKARREKLIDERWRVKERFVSMDRAWLPLLAGRGGLDWTTAMAERIADELIGDRLRSGDPMAWHDRTWVPAGGMATYVGVGGGEVIAVAAGDATDGTPIEAVAERFRSARVSGDTLVFGRGKYPIEGEIVLPPGKVLVLEKGARLTMAPGSGITVQGALLVRGTTLNPVFVRADDEGRPFRAIAVRADGRARCAISGLRMSGGGAGNVPMLSVQGAMDVQVRDAELAGLSITGGRADVERTVFTGRGTLLELDQVKGHVNGCTFLRGGTGLSVIGGRMAVRSSTFTGLTDRAIAADGAAQLLLLELTITGGGRGIDAADLAMVHVSGSRIQGNAVGIALRRADPVQGGARAVLHDVLLENNAQERDVDAYSGIDQVERLDPRVPDDFGVRLGAPAGEGAVRRR